MYGKSKTVFDNCNINSIADNFCGVIESAYGKFWEQDVKVVLTAINDFREIRDEVLIMNLDFFSSKIKVDKHKPVVIRLSRDFVEYALDSTLDTEKDYFEFTKLTKLEIKILNSFCEFLYKKLQELLISQEETKITEKSEQNFNFVFSIITKDNVAFKIMISIPQDRVKLDELEYKQSFKDEDFTHSSTTIKIRVGSTKVSLEELQNLSPDDIVILDDSELSKLILVSGDTKQKFNVKVNSSLIVDINNGDDETDDNNETYNEVKMSKNLWDDIQIEVNAEFEKVKMTIGELKQITEGQIVDLGALMDNEISLFVEDRKVAKGELIIINDRYAVRLNEVLNSETSKAPNSIKLETKDQGEEDDELEEIEEDTEENIEEDTEEEKTNEDEDFDYSDFEK